VKDKVSVPPTPQSYDFGDSRRTSYSDFYEFNEQLRDKDGKQIYKNFKGTKVLAHGLTQEDVEKRIGASAKKEVDDNTQPEERIKLKYHMGRETAARHTKMVI
jgi:hypothetical protein